MKKDGIGAASDDVERLLAESFGPTQHAAVREQLDRLEQAPMVRETERIKLAALIVAQGVWSELVDAVELGLIDWRDLLMAAFYVETHRERPRWPSGG